MGWRHSTAARGGSLLILTAVSLLLSGCGLFITPQHRVAIANSEIRAGEWQAAAGELRKVVHAHPHDAVAWQLLAEVSLDAGDVSGAQSSLDHAMTAGAKGPKVDALRLRVWLAAGKPKAVIAAITGHKVHPGEPTQSVDLARAYVATGQVDKALAILKPLLAQHPDLTQGRLVMAAGLVRQGQVEQALQQLDTAMQHDTKAALPPLLKGRILASRGNFAAAEQALAIALKRMPASQPLLERAEDLVALTEARLAQGKVDEAARSQGALARLVPGSPVTRLLAGRIELARGDLSTGANQLEAVVAQDPSYIEARLYLGAAELAQGNLQEAQQQLEEVIQASPANVEARKLLATVQLRLGNPEAALSELTPALASQPADQRLLYLVGAASRDSDSKPAVQALESALQAHSKDETAALNLARVQAATGDLASAKSTLTTALAAHPDALPVRIALAGVLAETKAFPQALALLKAADKPGAGPAIEFAIARVELAQGDLKHAQATLDQAIASKPGSAPLIAEAGVLLLAANHYDAALARFARATLLEPGNALYWLESARAQLALNQPAAARDSLHKAARIRPNWLPVVATLALMDVHAGKASEALASVNALVASRPSDAPALALKGYLESAVGDRAAAMAAYTQAQTLHPTAQVAVQLYTLRLAGHEADPQKPLQDWLARDPSDWRVHEVLGDYYLRIHDLRSAAPQLEATLRQSPDNVIALNNLAWIDSRLGDPQAEALAERAYKLAPQAAQVDDTLGWILARQQQAARAVPLLAEAVKRDPDDPEVAYHYAYALSHSGNPDEAMRILNRLLSTSQPFHSRADAQRLLAALNHT